MGMAAGVGMSTVAIAETLERSGWHGGGRGRRELLLALAARRDRACRPEGRQEAQRHHGRARGREEEGDGLRDRKAKADVAYTQGVQESRHTTSDLSDVQLNSATLPYELLWPARCVGVSYGTFGKASPAQHGRGRGVIGLRLALSFSAPRA